MIQRPIGFNGKPIPRGMLYSDYTPEQIEAACNAPDFEEKCKRAQDNADRMMELMHVKADNEIATAVASKARQLGNTISTHNALVGEVKRLSIAVPKGMLKAAVADLIHCWDRIPNSTDYSSKQVRLATAALKGALLWLAENPIVPTEAQVTELVDTSRRRDAWWIANVIGEWQRRMFLGIDDSHE